MTNTSPLTHAEPFIKIRASTGWAALNLREIWKFRDLLMSLATRDLKLRYKQTALGVIWVVVQPLLAAGIFSFVFGKVAQLPSDGVPYLLFSFAGLLGWNLFSSTVTKCNGCLVGNSQLISKVFFPRLILPLSTVPSVLVDFAVAAGMMTVLMLIYGVAPGWGLLLLPVLMGLLLMLALGIGLCTAALSVSYRDVQYIVPVFMQILLYASPIAYAVSAVPRASAQRLFAQSAERSARSLPRFIAEHKLARRVESRSGRRNLRVRLPPRDLLLQTHGKEVRRCHLRTTAKQRTIDWHSSMRCGDSPACGSSSATSMLTGWAACGSMVGILRRS